MKIRQHLIRQRSAQQISPIIKITSVHVLAKYVQPPVLIQIFAHWWTDIRKLLKSIRSISWSDKKFFVTKFFYEGNSNIETNWDNNQINRTANCGLWAKTAALVQFRSVPFDENLIIKSEMRVIQFIP